MRRCFSFVLVLMLLLSSGVWTLASAEPASLSVSAKSAVLMVAETGEVLYGKAEHEQRSMASTTKIMTALLACEENTPKHETRVTEAMNQVEGTGMGLKTGETVTLEALVWGAMLASGNDAANAIAIMLDGSLEAFAKKMNARAAQLNMQNTNFVTPSGLDAKEHYSTAYDMALLGSAALKNKMFSEICSTKNMKVAVGERSIYLSNHNRILREYPGCIGIKTGFTKKSGRCLVTAASRNGITLVCVTLSAPSDWSDHKKLLNFGFQQMESRAGKKQQYSLTVVGGIDKPLHWKLHKRRFCLKMPLWNACRSCARLNTRRFPRARQWANCGTT